MLPRIILHNAVSVDGRFDWFTPDVGLFYKQLSTWNEDATLVGSGTMLKASEESSQEDESTFQETTFDPNDIRPIVIVPDSRGQVRNWGELKKFGYWKHFVALCSKTTPPDYFDYLKKRHIECIIIGSHKVDLRKAIAVLVEKYGIKTLRVDSGGILNGILLRMGIVNEISVMFYPQLVGGISPKSFYQAPDLVSAEGIIDLKLISIKKLRGGVVWGRWEVIKEASAHVPLFSI